MMKKTCQMTETLAHGYSSESTRQELSSEYQHDRVETILKHPCVLVLWMKVASELEGLSQQGGLAVTYIVKKAHYISPKTLKQTYCITQFWSWIVYYVYLYKSLFHFGANTRIDLIVTMHFWKSLDVYNYFLNMLLFLLKSNENKTICYLYIWIPSFQVYYSHMRI